ncbi:phenylacetate--CoA ligase family protein [Alteromonas halophila]|uniref:Capsular polysaccharide biosynthesis protein n=1 Tax=Alteromonas halophila TaxID=516698 RepID=A0A918JKU3_9ALTE|nr:phenylacetate--CoA ligase family protein [Alteromonas halophila]GGW87004.1 capsular polysaccharide biosynthesis protein [Alteromonas halophila]
MSLYPGLFRTVLLPALDRVKGKGLTPLLKEYQQHLSWSPEQIETLQWQKTRALLTHAFETTVYYPKVWAEIGIESPEDIKTREDFTRLPLLTKDLVREHYDELVSSKHPDNIKKSTGGSTGQPFHFELNLNSNTRREAVMWRGYGWLGAGLGKKTMYLWGADLGQPSRNKKLKDALYHGFYNRTMLNSFNMTSDNMPEYVDRINAYKPDAMVSYVNPMVELASFITDKKLTVHSPGVILTGAEPLHEHQREIIEKAFGCPVHNTFGCREFMLIAAECRENQKLHINSDHLVVESLNSQGHPVIQESGDLVITDLHNYGMPLIRYVNGDKATMSDTPCACGNPLPVMESIDGRKLDVIKTRSGRMIAGELFPHMFKEFKAIQRFQVRQSDIDAVTIKMICPDGLNVRDQEKIKSEIDRYCHGELTIKIELVDNIPLTQSGKHRVTICEV